MLTELLERKCKCDTNTKTSDLEGIVEADIYDKLNKMDERIVQQNKSKKKLADTVDRRIINTNRNITVLQLENKNIREEISKIVATSLNYEKFEKLAIQQC